MAFSAQLALIPQARTLSAPAGPIPTASVDGDWDARVGQPRKPAGLRLPRGWAMPREEGEGLLVPEVALTFAVGGEEAGAP